MKDLIYYVLATTLIFSLVATPGWAWYDAWTYREPVNFSVGVNLTDYTVLINSTYNTNMSSVDQSDVRFTDESDNLLDYWAMETVNSSHVLFYVNGTFDTFNGTQLYRYYGMSGQTSLSNGTNTFPLFDDFPGTSFSADWATTGDPTVSSGSAHIDENDIIYHSATWGANYSVGGRWK